MDSVIPVSSKSGRTPCVKSLENNMPMTADRSHCGARLFEIVFVAIANRYGDITIRSLVIVTVKSVMASGASRGDAISKF